MLCRERCIDFSYESSPAVAPIIAAYQQQPIASCYSQRIELTRCIALQTASPPDGSKPQQDHQNQQQQQHSQTEVSTGSASLAAASGLLAIAGTAAASGKAGGLVLGSSESDGTPHPDHPELSIPSAAPPSPHVNKQQQQQLHGQQPLMLLQQQHMLMQLQAAAGFQAGYAMQGQPAASSGFYINQQQQQGQAAAAGNISMAMRPAYLGQHAAGSTTTATQMTTTAAGVPLMAYPSMAQPGQLMSMQPPLPVSARSAAAAVAAAAALERKAATTTATSTAASSGMQWQNISMGQMLPVVQPYDSGTQAATGGLQPKAELDVSHSNRRSLALRGPCFHCGTTISSQWRSGPADKPVLCNACGLYYRKVQSLPDHTCQVAGALSVSNIYLHLS